MTTVSTRITQVVNATTVDGVRVFWAAAPPPYRAVLSFRAGKVDETLPTAGVCHLVEHLALTQLFGRRYSFNGATGAVRTMFWAAGTEEDIADFLAAVCSSLARLDADRVEVERRILRAEETGRAIGAFGMHLGYRFGPRGLGLVGYNELGLHRLTAEDASAFAPSYMTAENAVLTLSGPPPANLRLPLPHGKAIPVPTSVPVDVPYPAWIANPQPAVSASFLGDRSTAAVAAVRMLERRLFQRARLDAGLSYGVHSTYEPISLDSAFSLVAADVLTGHETEASNLFVQTIEDITSRGFERADLDYERSQWMQGAEAPDAILGRLERHAFDTLIGGSPDDHDPIADIVRLHVDEATSALEDLLGTALLVLPTAESTVDGRYHAMPGFSDSAVSGEEFRLQREHAPEEGPEPRLIIGTEGISLRFDDDRQATVRWDDCACAVVDNLGRWSLFSGDGFRVVVDPSTWRRSELISGALDRHVPVGVRVTVTCDDTWVQPVTTSKGMLRSTATWALVVGLVFLVFMALGSVSLLIDPEEASDRPNGMAMLALFGGLGFWVGRELLKRRR